jgi:hypothetical protein
VCLDVGNTTLYRGSLWANSVASGGNVPPSQRAPRSGRQISLTLKVRANPLGNRVLLIRPGRSKQMGVHFRCIGCQWGYIIITIIITKPYC